MSSFRAPRVIPYLGIVLGVVVSACTPPSSNVGSVEHPRSPSPPAPWKADESRLSAGYDFTCGVRRDARVVCWGRNSKGQLGRGSSEENGHDGRVVDDVEDVVAVAAGGEHACALTREGRIACWGADDASLDPSGGVRPLAAFVPRAFGNARSITVGARHVCFTDDGNRPRCFGWGSDGQLGDGAATPRPSPMPVFGLDGVGSLSAGEAHTCATDLGGAIFCWGSGRDGRLGTGVTQTYAMVLTATRVGSAFSGSVVAGGRMTCAVERTGAVSCWGRHLPGRVLAEGDPAYVHATPSVVPGLERGALRVAVGHTHACAIRERGDVVCWGWNESGQLGDGTTEDSAVPREVAGLTERVVEVAAGRQHTCARSVSGAVSCWGRGAFGQLGPGRESSRVPVPVTTL
ncbi:MAG: hypothetical protein U0169_12800 [Polyangiaceae bacterium]